MFLLLKASSKINLLNDDTFRGFCVTVIMSSIKQIKKGVDYIGKSLIYLMRVRSGRASL